MSDEKGTRINKYLSEIGFCSRRKADLLIEQERIKVSGQIYNGLESEEDDEQLELDLDDDAEESVDDETDAEVDESEEDEVDVDDEPDTDESDEDAEES